MTAVPALPSAEPRSPKVVKGLSHKGRSLFRKLTSKGIKSPAVDVASLPQLELLGYIFGGPVAEGIDQASDGDIRNLAGWDVRDLTGIPNVDEGSAGKIAALFGLFSQLAQPMRRAA